MTEIELDDCQIALLALDRGDAAHAVNHLAGAVIDDPERKEVLTLVHRFIASTDDPLSLVPLGENNYAGVVALRAFVLARQRRSLEALNLLLQCVTALPESRLLTWLHGWLEEPAFVAALDVEEAGMSLHRFVFSIDKAERFAETVTALEDLRLAHPHHERLAYVHSVVLRRLGRFDEALQVAQQVLAGSNEYEWVIGLAAASRDAGHVDEAIEAYRRAGALAPADVAALLDIGDLLHNVGRTEEALQTYESALKREPEQKWAVASAASCRYRLTNDAVYLDQLEDLAKIGDARAAELAHRDAAFFGFLPTPSDATIHLFDQVAEKGGQFSNVGLSSIEAPSSRLSAALFAKARGFEREIAFEVGAVPEPDPRLPWAEVRFLLWRYDGIDPHPAVAAPLRSDITAAVIALADSDYDSDVWFGEAAEAEIGPRDESALRELLACMVHPPGVDPTILRPWVWLHRVQFASAMLIATLDPATPWASSLRRRGLHDLIHGPADWTTNAAVIALVIAAQHDPQIRGEALRWLGALYDRRPSFGAWPAQLPLLFALSRMPGLSEAARDRYREERRAALLDVTDEPGEPEPLPAPKKKSFLQRLFGR